MATITIRDLDDETRDRLRVRAARNGRSMEAEVRAILDRAVTAEPTGGPGAASRIRSIFADVGFADDLADAVPQRPTEAYFADADRTEADDRP